MADEDKKKIEEAPSKEGEVSEPEPKPEEPLKEEKEAPAPEKPEEKKETAEAPKDKPEAEKKEEKPQKEVPPTKEVPKEEKPKEEKTPKEETPADEKPKDGAPPEAPKKGDGPAKEAPSSESKPKEDRPAPPPKKAPQFNMLLFGKYDTSDVVIKDLGLAKYINLEPISVPHSGAKHANRPFAKGKVHIIERLVNNMMRTEVNTGKKTKTYTVVVKAFDIIQSKTKKNPVQIFIEAVENSTPREEVTRLRYGGVSVPKAVDVSSSRRLDIAIRNICKGAISAAHKNTKAIEMCLANEIMLAAKGDMNSFAVAKKEEVERIAGSAR